MNKDIPTTKAVQLYTALPDWLIADTKLLHHSLLTIAYLQTKPKRWLIRPKDVCKALGYSDKVWRKVYKQLKARGLIVSTLANNKTSLWYMHAAREYTDLLPAKGTCIGEHSTEHFKDAKELQEHEALACGIVATTYMLNVHLLLQKPKYQLVPCGEECLGGCIMHQDEPWL